jgi:hypothetical protein
LHDYGEESKVIPVLDVVESNRKIKNLSFTNLRYSLRLRPAAYRVFTCTGTIIKQAKDITPGTALVLRSVHCIKWPTALHSAILMET